MDKNLYDQLKATIEAEYRANLDALERTYAMAQKLAASTPAPQIIAPGFGTGAMLTVIPSLTTVVTRLIEEMEIGEQFTTADLGEKVRAIHGMADVKNADISGVLMNKKGKTINLVVKGLGGIPSTYVRIA